MRPATLLLPVGIVTGALLLLARAARADVATGEPTAPPPEPDPAPAPDPAPVRPSALALAQGEVGVSEEPPGSNTGPRVAAYLRPTGFTAAPWCASFISFVLHTAGVELLPYTARVAKLVSSARAIGRWHEATEGYRPRPGDLAVFQRSGQDPRQGGDGHVAIVEGVLPGIYTAIGGNESDAVRHTTRALGEGGLVGWIELPEAATAEERGS